MRWLSFALVTCFAVGCLEPTQITLELSTDVPCEETAGSAITVGVPLALETRDPVLVGQTCTAAGARGDLGSMVLVPSGDDDAPVGVKVALAVSDDEAETLTVEEGCLKPDYASHCIIARRSLRYLPNTPLVLPIELSRVCQGVFCDDDTTCVNGKCVDATVNPDDCTGPPGCQPGTGGGGAGGSGGGGGGAGGSGGGDACGEPEREEPQPIFTAQDGAAPTHLALAPDPVGCAWTLAWKSGQQLCAGRTADDEVACSALDPTTEVDGIDLIAFDGEHIAAVSSRDGTPGGLFRIYEAEGTMVIDPAGLPGVGGAVSLSTGADAFWVVYQPAPGPSVVWRRYRRDSTGDKLELDDEGTWSGVGATAAFSDAALLDERVALGIVDNNRPVVFDFMFGASPGAAVPLTPNPGDVTVTPIAVAQRGSRMGAFFVRENFDATLIEVANDMTGPRLSAAFSGNLGVDPLRVGLLATEERWVAWVSQGAVGTLWSLPLSDNGDFHKELPLEPPVEHLTVAARGEQLALAWWNTAELTFLKLPAAEID